MGGRGNGLAAGGKVKEGAESETREGQRDRKGGSLEGQRDTSMRSLAMSLSLPLHHIENVEPLPDIENVWKDWSVSSNHPHVTSA